MILDTNTYFFDNDDESSQIRRSNDNGDEIISTRKNRHLINDNNNEDRHTQNDDQNEKIDVAEDDENDEEEEDNTEKYMNDEEGSGGREVMSRDETSRNLGKSYSRYKNNSYRNKFSNKSQKLEGQKDVSFFDDEDDDDEDDDDDDEDEEKDKDGDRHLEGSGGNFNDDNSRNNDDEDDNAFFALKRKSNKYFRKNTNDAIKIISTPHGKVGIVYQQTPNTDKNINLKDKSMQPEQTDSSSSQNRDKFLSQKITPVLTADGKVALLYRGDSENTKYEPILNLTHAFNAIGKDNYDNKTSAVNNNAKVFDNDNDRNDGGVADRKVVVDVGSNGNHHHSHPHPHQPVNHLHNHHHHHYHHNSVSNNDSSRSSSVSNSSINSDNDMSTIKEDNHDIRPKFFEPDDSQKQEHQQYQYSSMSTSLSLNPLSDNNPILPIINRPLSEVLGIKKNQFRQFRIKDTQTEPTQKTIQTTPNNYVNYAQYTTTNFRQQQIPAVRSSTNFDTREFDDRISKYNQLDTGILRSESTNQHQHQQNEQNQRKEHDLDETQSLSSSSSITSSSSSADILGKTEVINLAIIPHFDEEFERQQRYHELENTNHRHYKQRHRYRHLNEDLSGVHCAMQAMMGVAAISTVFGMLGAFFKQRILDQIRMMHW